MSLILAHRGASGYAPENTLSAFEKALELGAHGIETDVHMTKDGQVVVCHDGRVDRTSDGSGRIYDMTLAQLKELDFGARYPGWQKRETILTLEQLLQWIEPTGLELNIELKFEDVLYPQIESKVLELVAGAGMAQRTIYSSFNHYSLRAIKQADAQARVGLLYNSALFEPWRYAAYVGADYIHPYYVTLQAPDVVKNCHLNHIGVHPYTVNDPEHLAWMCALGVDRIITNYPDRALAVCASALEGIGFKA